MKIDLSKNEHGLLLYLESRAVNNSGRVDLRHMNDEDIAAAEAWGESGFIAWGRLPADIFAYAESAQGRNGTHFVVLSATAWNVAHRERCARAGRLRANFIKRLEQCDSSAVQGAARNAYKEANGAPAAPASEENAP